MDFSRQADWYNNALHGLFTITPLAFYLCERQISETFLQQRNGPHSTFPFRQSHDEGRCPEQGNPCPPLNTLTYAHAKPTYRSV